MSTYIGPSESQSRAVYGETRQLRAPMYTDLRIRLAWFRTEWQAVLTWRLHDGFSSVGDLDALGGPAWSRRFEAYLTESPRDPLRIALAEMARGSMFDRAGARFLFVLACCDFDPRAAGLAMTDHRGHALILPEFASWYAEKALDRLRERVERLPDREKPSGARLLPSRERSMQAVG